MKNKKIRYFIILSIFFALTLVFSKKEIRASGSGEDKVGGGYAVTGQTPEVGYTTEIYDASNGLPSSDANCILGAKDGYIWIGGYCGIIRYDGSNFERFETGNGLTSGRMIFEDSKGRIWVGTNDNGAVLIDGDEQTHFTYKEGLPSSSIREFAEDESGNIIIGTTAGLAYYDKSGNINVISDEKIDGERIVKLDNDSDGIVYGCTRNGIVFKLIDLKITELYESKDLGIGSITTILVDKNVPGNVYLGTGEDYIYYGSFGDKAGALKKISVAPLNNVHWLSYDCNRVWVSSSNMIGYIDEAGVFEELKNLPMDSAIEMTASDYQGNIWVVSSTQGIMKIVTNNYIDLTENAGLSNDVVNSTSLYNEKLFIATDRGLKILDKDLNIVENRLTELIGEARIRCTMKDSKGNLWISGYTENLGLIELKEDGSIRQFTEKEGMPSDEIRCSYETEDGRIFVGTNGGIAIIKDDEIIDVLGAEEGIKNTVILTLAEGFDNKIYAGSDGDGVYVIEDRKVSRLGRDDGLTSDVILRIKKDKQNGVLWLVTSNSIEYIKGTAIKNIRSFPYNNNYDIYFGINDEMWILSSYGIYKVKTGQILEDKIEDYKLYTISNGLPYAITSNSYSELDENGNLYISGRNGVIKVNIYHYFEKHPEIKVAINSVYCGDLKIVPDLNGDYVIPSSKERIRIQTSIMDYTMLNPLVRLYLENSDDSGITVQRSELHSLEYMGLPYGDYKLHIEIVDNERNVILEKSFVIKKKPRLEELTAVRALILLLVIVFVGVIVWRFVRTIVIKKQYDEVKKAKDEAERASTAKTRFLANMSDDIRTPINTILGMNEMILRENSKDVPKGYFLSIMNYSYDIKKASESLLSLINGILEISRIESGKSVLKEREYDLTDTLRKVIEMVQSKCADKALTFDVTVDEMIPRKLYGDEGKIRQVVFNLLSNAVKFTDHGGIRLDVLLKQMKGDKCVLSFSVIDTGIGIKEGDIDKIFNAYDYLARELNSGSVQRGLGLDISKRFTDLMSGTLSCKSKVDEGTEFIFTVPEKIIDKTPIGKFSTEKEEMIGGPYLPKFIAPDADILVVDENPMNLYVIKELLKATKVFVTTASSGEEAIDKIRENHFHVAIIDQMMIEMDGHETAEKVRAFNKKIPIYLLSSDDSSNENDPNINGYIRKPIDSVKLEEIIAVNLPESMMEKPKEEDIRHQSKELPESMEWLRDIKELSVDDGIKNSGNIDSFIFSLKLFYETIDYNVANLKASYDESDYKSYRIRIGGLITSTRIIGARHLMETAKKMYEALVEHDLDHINVKHKELIREYESFKEVLAKLG